MANDHLAYRLFTEISIIEHLSRSRFAKLLPSGLTPAQFNILNHLTHRGPSQSPAQIAFALQVSRPTMSSTLTKLDRARLVEITPDKSDGRGKVVTLTQSGRDMRDRCVGATAVMAPDIEAALSDDDLATILPILTRLRKRLDDARGHWQDGA